MAEGVALDLLVMAETMAATPPGIARGTPAIAAVRPGVLPATAVLLPRPGVPAETPRERDLPLRSIPQRRLLAVPLLPLPPLTMGVTMTMMRKKSPRRTTAMAQLQA